MREDTIGRKKASRLFQQLRGRRWLLGRMLEVISEGKRGLDGLALELGRMVAEAVMYLEREEIAGPDYRPYRSEVRKWASQPGSVFSLRGRVLHCDNVLLQDLTLCPREKADEIIAAVRGLDSLPKIETLADLLVP